MYGCQSCLWSAEEEINIFSRPLTDLRIWSRKKGTHSTHPGTESLNLVAVMAVHGLLLSFFYRFPHRSRLRLRLCRIYTPSTAITAIGSVPRKKCVPTAFVLYRRRSFSTDDVRSLPTAFVLYRRRSFSTAQSPTAPCQKSPRYRYSRSSITPRLLPRFPRRRRFFWGGTPR